MPFKMKFTFLFPIMLYIMSYVVGASCDPYVPGTPGGPWTDSEIAIVREKVLQMLNQTNYFRGHPPEFRKNDLLLKAYKGCTKDSCEPTSSWGNKLFLLRTTRRPNAAKLLRLAFHDCVSSIDENGNHFGGCDGCLNWEGMGFMMKEALSKKKKPFKYPIPTHGDNNALQLTVRILEMIYTNASWPENAPSLEISLRESGKSRADLWQFAANVALEEEIVRANFACDYHPAHQQASVLEGRENCLIKLHKPIAWQYGRADCVPDEEKKLTDLPYESTNKETGYNAHGTGRSVLETLKDDFGLTAEEGISLMAVHATNRQGRNKMQSTKYRWIGHYLGNMYYKILSSAPLYEFEELESFLTARDQERNLRVFILRGDKDGNPMNGTRWTPHFHKLWKRNELNPDGGPIHFRPTTVGCGNMEHTYAPNFHCIEGFDEFGKLRIDQNNPHCAELVIDDQNILRAGGRMNHNHPCAKSFLFAFPYELSFVYNFTVNDANYPGGCHPFEESLKNIWNRPLEEQYTKCPSTDYAPEGKSTSQIMMDFALDNVLWQRIFLESWQKMQSNGYENLKDGPKSSWLGYSYLKDLDLGETCFSTNTMFRGKPVRGIKDFHIKNIMSPKDCQRECEKDDDCNNWTWFGPDIQGKQAKDSDRKNTCWLKWGIGKKKSNCKWCHGKVSGPKTCLDSLEFPLLFTNNSNANPMADKRDTSFSKMCQMMVNEGLEPDNPKANYIWQSPSENGRKNGYTPCPPELMKNKENK